MPPTKFGFGKAVRRKEDDAFVRGVGRYVADYVPGGLLHAVVLRSPHAHARFRITDLAKARALPGVAWCSPRRTPPNWAICRAKRHCRRPGSWLPPYPVLARGGGAPCRRRRGLRRGRHARAGAGRRGSDRGRVGGAAARDRRRSRRSQQGAPSVWPEAKRAAISPSRPSWATPTPSARGFAKATRTVSLTLVNQRLVANYLDTRGGRRRIRADDRIHADAGQPGQPQRARRAVPDMLEDRARQNARRHARCRRRLRHQALSLSRICARGRRGAAARAAGQVGRRSQRAFSRPMRRAATTSPRRSSRSTSDGRFLALDVDLVADMGAYLSCYAPFIPFIGAGMSPGVYDIPACHVRIRGAFTNTVPVDAYRGAGRPEAAYVIERLVDVAAREIGVAPDALRRQNFIKAHAATRPRPARPTIPATSRANGARAGARRLERLRAAAGALAQARTAARHRPRDLYRGLRQ